MKRDRSKKVVIRDTHDAKTAEGVLCDVIRSLPAAEEHSKEDAVRHLLIAARNYQQSFSVRDGATVGTPAPAGESPSERCKRVEEWEALAEKVALKVRLRRPSMSVARTEAQDLIKALASAEAALSALSPPALRAFVKTSDAPKGKASQELRRMRRYAEAAAAALVAVPASSDDSPLAILAWQVASVLRDVLRIRPSKSNDDLRVTGARGGAGFARVLRAVILLAGGKPPTNLKRWLEVGINLLEDPTMPDALGNLLADPTPDEFHRD